MPSRLICAYRSVALLLLVHVSQSAGQARPFKLERKQFGRMTTFNARSLSSVKGSLQQISAIFQPRTQRTKPT